MSADKDTRVYGKHVAKVKAKAQELDRSFTYTVNNIIEAHLSANRQDLHKGPKLKKG